MKRFKRIRAADELQDGMLVLCKEFHDGDSPSFFLKRNACSWLLVKVVRLKEGENLKRTMGEDGASTAKTWQIYGRVLACVDDDRWAVDNDFGLFESVRHADGRVVAKTFCWKMYEVQEAEQEQAIKQTKEWSDRIRFLQEA